MTLGSVSCNNCGCNSVIDSNFPDDTECNNPECDNTIGKKTLLDKLRGITISFGRVNQIKEHDKEETIKANARLNELEKMLGEEMSQGYREGFVQGWIERSWIQKDKQ